MSATDHEAPLYSGGELFGRTDAIIVCCTALILFGVIVAIDRMTGYDLRLAVLHLGPIAMVTWTAGRAWGLLLSVVAVAFWAVMFRGSHHYAGNFYHYVDGVMLLVTFSIVVLLLSRIRTLMRNEGRRFADALECLDGAAYVADPALGAVLYGNRRCREDFADQSYAALEQAWRDAKGAKSREISWPNGHPVLLRTLPAAQTTGR